MNNLYCLEFNTGLKRVFIFFLLYSAFIYTAAAQIELKTNPFGIFINSPNIASEYLWNENISLELDAKIDYGSRVGPGISRDETSLSNSGYNVSIACKYFARPKKGHDRFYVGIYAGWRNRTTFANNNPESKWIQTSFYAGLTGGLKWVGASGIIIDLSGGYGRAIGYQSNSVSLRKPGIEIHAINYNANGSDAFVKIGIGYRISKPQKEDKEDEEF